MGSNEKKQDEMVEPQSITLPNGIVITSFGNLVTISASLPNVQRSIW